MVSINKLDRNKPKCFLVDHIPEYDWEAYLETNLAIVIKVNSGRINRDKLLFGIRENYGEQQRTDDEQIETLYQKLL